MKKQDTPNFSAWHQNNLVDFAKQAYTRMQEQEDAIAQLRLDLKDAMKLLRSQHKE